MASTWDVWRLQGRTRVKPLEAWFPSSSTLENEMGTEGRVFPFPISCSIKYELLCFLLTADLWEGLKS